MAAIVRKRRVLRGAARDERRAGADGLRYSRLE